MTNFQKDQSNKFWFIDPRTLNSTETLEVYFIPIESFKRVI